MRTLLLAAVVTLLSLNVAQAETKIPAGHYLDDHHYIHVGSPDNPLAKFARGSSTEIVGATETNGEITVTFRYTTYGSGVMLLELSPGLHVLKATDRPDIGDVNEISADTSDPTGKQYPPVGSSGHLVLVLGPKN